MYVYLVLAQCHDEACPLWQVGPSHSSPPHQPTFHTDTCLVLRIYYEEERERERERGY